MEVVKFMDSKRISLNDVTYTVILSACAAQKALDLGRYVRKHMIQHKAKPTLKVLTSLLAMFAQCKCIEEAETTFKQIRQYFTPDTILWSNVIGMFVDNKLPKRALDLFYELENEKITPN